MIRCQTATITRNMQAETLSRQRYCTIVDWTCCWFFSRPHATERHRSCSIFLFCIQMCISHRLRIWKLLKLPWRSLSRKTNISIFYDYGITFMSSVRILSFSFSLLHVKPQYVSNSITQRTLLHLRVVARFTYFVWKRICCLLLNLFSLPPCFTAVCQLAPHSAWLSQGTTFSEGEG